jgi:hypothetical protein
MCEENVHLTLVATPSHEVHIVVDAETPVPPSTNRPPDAMWWIEVQGLLDTSDRHESMSLEEEARPASIAVA